MGELHNEELHILYSCNIVVINSRKIKVLRLVASIGKTNLYKILVRKPHRKRLCERPRYIL